MYHFNKSLEEAYTAEVAEELCTDVFREKMHNEVLPPLDGELRVRAFCLIPQDEELPDRMNADRSQLLESLRGACRCPRCATIFHAAAGCVDYVNGERRRGAAN